MDSRRLFNDINTLKRKAKHLDGRTFSSNLTITGDATLGNASSDIATITAQLTASQGGYFANRVGIGTTTPGAKLDVDGSVIFNESGADVDFRVESDGNTNMLFVDGGNDRIGIGTATPLHTLSVTGTLAVSGNSTFGDASSDVTTVTAQLTASQGGYFATNVGIGTASPGASLEVKDGGFLLTDNDVVHGITNVAPTNAYGDFGPIHSTYGGLMINGLSDQENAGARSLALRGVCNDTHTDTVATVEIIGAKRSGTTVQALDAAETVLQVANHTTTLMTVLGSGNVGIGTASPSYALEVAGNVGFDEWIYHNGDTNTHIRFTDDDINFTAGGVNFIDLTQGGTNEITFNEAGADVDFRVEGDTQANLLFVDASTDRVGIGTSAPEAYLDIKNTTDDGTTNRTMLRLHNYRSDDADVNDFGPISIDFVIENLGGGAKEGLARIAAVSSPAGTDHTSILGEKTSGLIFSTMNDDTLAEAMRINHSGYLGIGTTSPATKLHVKGGTGTSASVIKLEQLDTDEPFIRFEGTTASDQTKSLSTDTSVGSLTGHIRVSINGTDYWIPYYATN